MEDRRRLSGAKTPALLKEYSNEVTPISAPLNVRLNFSHQAISISTPLNVHFCPRQDNIP